MSLYDPGEFPNEFPTETVTSPDFTLADVLAWARTKPRDEVYCYLSNGHCAISQFLKETGRAERPSVGPRNWFDMGSKRSAGVVDEELNDAAGGWCDARRRTFGAFADRLEKALS